MRSRLAQLLLCILLALGPAIVSPFYVTLLNFIGLYSLVALGLVLLTGSGGLLSFGQAAFVGIGAYVTAYLTTAYGVSPWLTLPAGVALTAAVAVVIGYVTLQLSGHYLPLGTIAWGMSIYFLFGNVQGFGQHSGITGLPAVELFGFRADSPDKFYYLIWIAVIAALISISNILDSRPGRVIRSLRGGDLLAEAFGAGATRYKMAIFVYAAVLAGVAGWLYAHLLRFVSPQPFGVNTSIEYLFAVVLGGAAYAWGAVLGSAIIVVVKQWLQDLLPSLLSTSGNFEIVVFGVLMIFLLQRSRNGLIPFLRRLVPKTTATKPLLAAEPLPRREAALVGENLLALDNVRKTFGGLIAVNDMSFVMRSGEILALIGPNGAGKTTIFNLVTGVLPATSGHILLRGERIDGLPTRQIARRGIVRTFQLVEMRPQMTVIENIALGAHLRGHAGIFAAALRLDRSEERRLLFEAQRQAERVGLGDHLFASAGSLSLGQQRLLEVARALCADPIMLLLDEPAAGLRYREKEALAQLLRDLKKEGMSILLVEHDMNFVMDLVDRLVVMDFGTQIAEGKPATIQSDPRVIEAYLGSVI